jgi:uncharacterized membrane protein
VADVERQRESGDDAPSTARLEMFSDGVFAIAITLLVIEVRVPELEHSESLRHELWQEWPSYLGYVLSFLIIGIMWVNHHMLFRFIVRGSHALLLMNGLLLMCVAFVPFPTAVLAEYLRDSGEATTAMVFYAGFFTFTAIVYNLLWRTAASGYRLIDPAADRTEVDRITKAFVVGPIVYFVSTLVALVSVPTSLAILGALAIFYLFPSGRRLRPSGPTQ